MSTSILKLKQVTDGRSKGFSQVRIYRSKGVSYVFIQRMSARVSSPCSKGRGWHFSTNETSENFREGHGGGWILWTNENIPH
jgi:hypothetical protein